jgi:transcriptional regulator with XRE-family HTH domain
VKTFLDNIGKELFILKRNRSWLAREAKINISTINMWFSKGYVPKLTDAYEIAKVLKVSMEYLLTGKEYKTNKIFKDENAQYIYEKLKTLTEEELIEVKNFVDFVEHKKISPEKEDKKRAG